MTLWLRVRLAWWIGASLIVATVVTVAVEQAEVAVPNLVGGVSTLPIALLGTLAPATLTGVGLSRGLASEFACVRNVWRYDTTLLAGLAVGAAGCAALAFWQAGIIALAMFRATVGLARPCGPDRGGRGVSRAPGTAPREIDRETGTSPGQREGASCDVRDLSGGPG